MVQMVIFERQSQFFTVQILFADVKIFLICLSALWWLEQEVRAIIFIKV